MSALRQRAELPVIFLTSKDDEIDELLGLRMGADDYIKKPFSQRLLIERIRAVLRRRWPRDRRRAKPENEDHPARRADARPDAPLCTWKGAPVNLTVTEFLILQALAQRPGHVKSRDQLMDAAYGEHIYVDDRTIDSHIKRLRKKFKDVDDDFAQIETLYGVGYRYRRRLSGERWGRTRHGCKRATIPSRPSPGASWPSTWWPWRPGRRPALSRRATARA